MRLKKSKTYAAFLLAIFLLLFPFASRASFLGTVDISGPIDSNILDPGGLATIGMFSIFDSLGMETDPLTSFISQFNVLKKKQIAPKVSLMFSPSNPEPGEKITASAIPTYFLNDTKNLYFTWFLKSKDCDKTDSPSSEEKEKCDLNNDGKVDVDDWEIKAMRIIANNGFDWESAKKNKAYDHSYGDSSYEASFGGNDQKGNNNLCYVQDVSSGETYQLTCDSHLFPKDPEEHTGDGSFGRKEEEFWRTDPASADTAQTGNTDEANVAGLGEDTFTWNYKSGDEVGVVVEGVAVSTNAEDNSSSKVMWAAPNGLCHKTTIGEGTMSSVSDLRECLYNNLVTPSENSASSNKLDVSLSYSPTSPINYPGSYTDPSLSNGDELTVQSSVTNANDRNYLQYSWQVFEGDDPAPDSWGDPLAKADLPNATQMDGIGLNSFKFKLNLASPKKYLDVKLTVKESAADGTREGRSDVVIPLNSNGDTISAFSTSTSSSTSDPQITFGDEICTKDDSLESAVCPVAKDSIIGLKLSSSDMTDYSWTVDGTSLNYSNCFFDGCEPDKQSSTTIFPVLKEVGDSYTVKLTATNSETGNKLNLSRTFQVVDPSLSITSDDENVCKAVQLGNYIDTDGKTYPDYSKKNFQSLAGNSIKLNVSANGFSPDPDQYTWIVDGNAIDQSNATDYGYAVDDNGVLTLPAGNAGESHVVSVVSTYSQDNATLAALRKYWGVSYGQFYEKDLSSSINITAVDSISTTAAAKAKKITATLYSGIPAYLAFLLRIALTIAMILFVSRLILSFFPEMNRED